MLFRSNASEEELAALRNNASCVHGLKPAALECYQRLQQALKVEHSVLQRLYSYAVASRYALQAALADIVMAIAALIF